MEGGRRVAFGYDWPNAPERLRKMEETIELTKRLWVEDEVDYDGDYYQLDGAICRPQPRQNHARRSSWSAGRREFTLRIAAKHADEWNYWGRPTSSNTNSTCYAPTARRTARRSTISTSPGSRGVSSGRRKLPWMPFSTRCRASVIQHLTIRSRRTTTSSARPTNSSRN